MSVCEGCGNALSAAYQCPLCQAEGKVDAGLYCGQSCFAQHWLEHRNTCHKRGVVRAKAAAPAVTQDDAAKDTKGADKNKAAGKAPKRARETQDDVAKEDNDEKEEAVMTHYMPWLPLPSRTVCTTNNINNTSTPPSITVDPPLTLDCAHAIVAVHDDNVTANTNNEDENVLRHTFWPAVMAATEYIGRCFEANAAHKEAIDELRVVVVAADEQSAGGFAWAARCAGLTRHTSLYLAVNRESNTTKSDVGSEAATFFTPARRLVIVTAAVLREMAESGSKHNDTVAQKNEYEVGLTALLGSTSSRHALLVTLPGVHDVAAVKASDKTRTVRHVAFVATNAKAARKTQIDKTAGQYSNHSKVTHTLKVAGANNPVSSVTASRKKKGKAQKGKESISDITPNTVTLPQWESLPLKQTTVAVYRTVMEQQQQQSESATLSSVSEEESTLYRSLITYPRVDNDVLSDLVMGNMDNALRRLVQLHAARPGEAEDLIRNSLLCSWGAMSVAHAHHRLAYVMRYLIDHSTHGSAVVKGTNSLSEVTLRALVPLCRALPPITTDNTTLFSESTQNATPSASELKRYFNYYNTTVPNIQLQATLCHLHDAASVAILDSLAQAWGITHGITGYNALQEQHKRREKHVRRIVSRYGTRLGSRYARFLVLLMHFIYDTVGPYSLSVAELERRLMWNVTLAHDVGPLRGFLTNCGLLSDNAEQTTTKEAATSETKTPNALSSRLTGRAAQNAKKSSDNSSKREEEVKLMNVTEYSALPWQTFPRSAQRGQTIDRLRRAALEELLMALPRQARPMYIGDVGNLIGKWSAFNAKYDGVLGVSLSEFLHSQPETFQVVGTLVTRRVSGAGPQVRVRYDAEDYHHTQDDSDEDEGTDSQRRREKAHDRALLTGLGKEKNKKKNKMEGLPARARKKRARKELNRARFNRNYKSVDPSARVPGYVKHAPRRVKGRGRKPNKRVVKRGNN